MRGTEWKGRDGGGKGIAVYTRHLQNFLSKRPLFVVPRKLSHPLRDVPFPHDARSRSSLSHNGLPQESSNPVNVSL